MDGFFIKQTKDIKGSISYLTIMTRQLQKKYTVNPMIIVKQKIIIPSLFVE